MDYYGTTVVSIQGDTRSLDYSSNNAAVSMSFSIFFQSVLHGC